MSAAQLPDRAQITAAARLLAPHLRRTPVLAVELAGHTIALKLELLQHTGSFKPRGAFATVLGAKHRPVRLVAASGGNHGLAVAHVGRALGIPAVVFVPTISAPVKVARLRALGAQVVQTGALYADALAASAELAAAPGSLAIHAYDALGTVAGQGTLGRELDEQLDATGLDTVLVAVGGGWLIAGIAAWFAGRAVRVVAVEPQGCPTLSAALAAGRPVTIAPTGLAADSLGASIVGQLCFAAAARSGLRSLLVDDDEIRLARDWLWRECRLAAEPGGATALAALLSGRYRPAPGERVAVIVCGANTDPATLPRD